MRGAGRDVARSIGPQGSAAAKPPGGGTGEGGLQRGFCAPALSIVLSHLLLCCLHSLKHPEHVLHAPGLLASIMS